MTKYAIRIAALLIVFNSLVSSLNAQKKILVFNKITRFYHQSIPDGQVAIQNIAAAYNINADTTSNAAFFQESILKQYAAVVFLNTSGDLLLNNNQKSAFERFIQAGGGFVGVHGAAASCYEWPWYGRLLGAVFNGHPEPQKGVVRVVDSLHPSTKHLPRKWSCFDEWYNYKDEQKGRNILLSLDETTYSGGTQGADHPISWYRQFDGGRSFYTGLGHTKEMYSDSFFLKHLAAGILYAVGNDSLNYKKSTTTIINKYSGKPEESGFVKTVLAGNYASPMELTVADDGRIFITELNGRLSVFDRLSGRKTLIHQFAVPSIRGTGLIGITLDPGFTKNNFIYVYYSPRVESDDSLHFNLSRFVINKKNKIDTASERILLQVPIHKLAGSHYGGSLKFDRSGNLFLSTGDGTLPFPSNGYAPLDERPGAEYYHLDAQRSSANTNSLQGKILRIRPLPNGSYEIPSGNLFEKSTARTRPEIYIMGTRNPYRIAVNPETSTLYWGDIGPDAGIDSLRGPRGYDEFNQARKAGNYGWPYFIADNQAYSEWDFSTNSNKGKFDIHAPENNSPNNTGITKLPLPQPSMIWYPYVISQEFPVLGLGGRCAIAGDFYRYKAHSSSPYRFPEYYHNKLFIADWMRNWIMAVHFDVNENYEDVEEFMTDNGDFRRPIDMEFGSDGILYLLEYGSVYGADNDDARLVKIEYRPVSKKLTAPKPKEAVRMARPVPPAANLHPGKIIMESSDCKACHQLTKKAVGPSYVDIARRYKKENGAVQRLAAKIISGGAGNWGTDALMSAHPQITQKQAEQMVEYIFTLTK